MKARFKELDKDNLAALLMHVSIAIVTVTRVEKEAFYNYFMPLPDHKAIIKVIMGKDVYYIGRFGLYNVLHIHSAWDRQAPMVACLLFRQLCSISRAFIIVLWGELLLE